MDAANDNKTEVAPPRSGLRRALRILVILMSLAMMLAAGAATLLAFAGRDVWRLELLCHFRVQYFWILTMAAVLAGLVRERVLMLAAAAVAGINLAVIAPLYFGPGGTAPDSKSTIRAIGLNLHYSNREHDAVIDLVRREQPDFAFFFEVTPTWAVVLSQLKDEYPYSEVIPSHYPIGMALFSKYKITDLKIEDLGPLGLPCIVAGLETPEGRLTAIGAHPASPRSEQDFTERNQALKELADVIAKRSGPIVLLADLNTTSWSPHFQDLVRGSGLRDSRYGFGVQPSWPWVPMPLRIPIDHCLASPEIVILDRRIGPAIGSDHRPVVVDFAY